MSRHTDSGREPLRGYRRFSRAIGLLALLSISLLPFIACEEYLSEVSVDTVPPTMTGLVLSPDSVNLTVADAEVSARVGVRSMASVDSVRIELENTEEYELSCLVTEPSSGDRERGDWSCTIPFTRDVRAGAWQTRAVALYPEGGDPVRFTTTEFDEAGYRHMVRVVKVSSLEIVDRTGPLILRAVDDTLHLTAVAYDEDGLAMSEVAIVWSSEDTTVAVVDDDGLVTATGEGETTIIAGAEGLETTIDLIVDPNYQEEPELIVEMIYVEPDTIDLYDLPDAIPVAMAIVVPASGSAPIDSLSAVMTGPGSESFTCEVSQLVSEAELSDLGLELPEGAPSAWACLITFGNEFPEEDPEVEVPILTPLVPVELGTWRFSEFSLMHDSEWVVFGEEELSEGEFDLEVEVVSNRPEVDWIVVQPRGSDGGVELVSLLPGDTILLGATGYDEDGWPVSGVDYLWSSGDTTVATVDQHGLVRAVGRGFVEISASVDDAVGTLGVAVEELPGIHLIPDTLDLANLQHSDGMAVAHIYLLPGVGMPEIEDLSVGLTGPGGEISGCYDVRPASPGELGDVGIELEEGMPEPWVCINHFGIDYDGPDPGTPDSIALGSWKVSEIHLTYEEGYYFHFSEDHLSRLEDELQVEVIRGEPAIGPVEFVVLLPADTTLSEIGDTVRLTATAYDSFENVVEGVEFAWETDDESVALVDETGLVTALGPGTATISAHFEGVIGETTITVEDPIAAVYWDGWTVVGSSYGPGEGNVALSADGSDWIGALIPIEEGWPSAVATNGELWIAGLTNNGVHSIATSVDALEWTIEESPLAEVHTIVWSEEDQLWYAGGSSDQELGPALIVSPDGIEWTERDVTGLNSIDGLAHNGEFWVAVGNGSGDAIATSNNGIDWTPRSAPLFFGNEVAWDGSTWIVVGSDVGSQPRVLTSLDGIEWTEVETPITDFVEGVATSGATWVLTGTSSSGGEPHILTSPDGVEWTTSSSPFITGAESSFWNGQLWLASGWGAAPIATSEDGFEWSEQSVPLENVSGIGWGGPRPLNQAPNGRIVAPESDMVVQVGATVHFMAEDLYDEEDGTLPASSVVWTSDLDGELGVGPEIERSDLSEGVHTITLTLTDSDGAITRRHRVLTVEAPQVPQLYAVGSTSTMSDLTVPVGLYVIPATGSIPLDTLEMTLTGPDDETSFTCELAQPLEPSDIAELGLSLPPDAPTPWGCLIVFGAEFDPDLGLLPLDPEDLEDFAFGTWRLTEVALGYEDGAWHLLDEAALVAAGHQVSIEVSEQLDIQWISVEPWRHILTNPGETVQLYATAFRDELDSIPGLSYEWSSADPTIATVDAEGLVTGVGPGEVEIFAHAFGHTGSTRVIVIESGPPLAWDTVVAGDDHSCGLIGGQAYCWGSNLYGQLGTGDMEDRLVPTPVAGGHDFVSLAAGSGYTMALDADGKAYAWGNNSQGQLGDGTTTEQSTPVQVAGTHSFVSISAGRSHSAAIDIEGNIFTWGDDTRGQLGSGGMARDELVPTQVMTSHTIGETFTAVVARGEFTIALSSSGVAYSWGYNANGQLGHGNKTSTNEPMPIFREDGTGLHEFVMISAGGDHVIALDPDGQIWSWGWGLRGRLGSGSEDGRLVPGKISGSQSFTWIGAGTDHNLALTASGQIWGWGSRDWGALGDGTSDIGDYDHHFEPRELTQLSAQGYTLLVLGDRFTLGLRVDGTAYGWGYNGNGQLGNASFDAAEEPDAVLGPGPSTP